MRNVFLLPLKDERKECPPRFAWRAYVFLIN